MKLDILLIQFPSIVKKANTHESLQVQCKTYHSKSNRSWWDAGMNCTGAARSSRTAQESKVKRLPTTSKHLSPNPRRLKGIVFKPWHREGEFQQPVNPLSLRVLRWDWWVVLMCHTLSSCPLYLQASEQAPAVIVKTSVPPEFSLICCSSTKKPSEMPTFVLILFGGNLVI